MWFVCQSCYLPLMLLRQRKAVRTVKKMGLFGYFFLYVCPVLMCACIRCVLYKEGAIQLKASGSEQRSLKAVGVSHIKQTAASKQLYRLCLIGEKDFKHTPKTQNDQDINKAILSEYYWYQLWWFLALDECFIYVLARHLRPDIDLQINLIPS